MRIVFFAIILPSTCKKMPFFVMSVGEITLGSKLEATCQSVDHPQPSRNNEPPLRAAAPAAPRDSVRPTKRRITWSVVYTRCTAILTAACVTLRTGARLPVAHVIDGTPLKVTNTGVIVIQEYYEDYRLDVGLVAPKVARRVHDRNHFRFGGNERSLPYGLCHVGLCDC